MQNVTYFQISAYLFHQDWPLFRIQYWLSFDFLQADAYFTFLRIENFVEFCFQPFLVYGQIHFPSSISESEKSSY